MGQALSSPATTNAAALDFDAGQQAVDNRSGLVGNQQCGLRENIDLGQSRIEQRQPAIEMLCCKPWYRDVLEHGVPGKLAAVVQH